MDNKDAQLDLCKDQYRTARDLILPILETLKIPALSTLGVAADIIYSALFDVPLEDARKLLANLTICVLNKLNGENHDNDDNQR